MGCWKKRLTNALVRPSLEIQAGSREFVTGDIAGDIPVATGKSDLRLCPVAKCAVANCGCHAYLLINLKRLWR
jgi:hypothetical protein